MAGELDLFPPEPEVAVSPGREPFTLRPYQTDSVDAVFASWEHHDSVLMVKATGLGKTVTFAEVIARWPEEQGRVLVVVHREELMQQACDSLAAHLDARPQVEMGFRRADSTGLMTASNVVVTSVQTMSRPKRAKWFDAADFGMMIIDEAHHAPANSYRRVIEYFKPGGLKLLGVTATPIRKDKLALANVFETCCYNMGIIEGIDEGWLVNVRQKYITVEGLDFSWIKTTAGDLNQKQLAQEMGAIEVVPEGELSEGQIDQLAKQERMLHAVAAPSIKEAAGRPTLVFAVTKEHARRLTEVFNRYPGVTAQCVIAETDREDRAVAVRQFHAGDLQVLVGVGCFLEGFDAPATACVVMAAPTKSELRYTQAVGRGTRPLAGIVDGLETASERRAAIAASDKPFVTVLDFVGNSGRHRLMSAVDVLAGDADPADIAAAVEDLREHGDAEEVQAVIDRAKDVRELREAQEAQRRAEAEARRARLRANAQYNARIVNPFGAQGSPGHAEPAFQGGASGKQVAYLVRLGVAEETASGYTRRQAGAVIDKLASSSGSDYIMRFGKHGGRRLRDIPATYLNWVKTNIDNAELRTHIDETLGE